MNILKCFPSKYVKAVDLSGREITVQIARISIEEVGTPPDVEQKPVLYFVNATKGLILNKTLGLTVAQLYGNETDGWTGKWVILYPTQVRAFGKVHDVIRIKPQIPPKSTKPTSQPSEPSESQLDDLDDVIDAEDVDDVPFTHQAADDDAQPDFAPDDAPATAQWHSPPAAQAWAIEQGLAANAEDARKLWLEAVKACQGFDRTKAPVVYAKYVEMLRARQPA